MRRGTSLFVICLLAALPAFAGDYESGRDAFRRGDYAQALTSYRKAAEQGNATAQNELGLMYDKGIGVAKDSALAAQWYRKGAEGGSPVAQFNLGVLYMVGRGVSQDYSQAARWYRKAADQGANHCSSHQAALSDACARLMNTPETIDTAKARTERLIIGGALVS